MYIYIISRYLSICLLIYIAQKLMKLQQNICGEKCVFYYNTQYTYKWPTKKNSGRK